MVTSVVEETTGFPELVADSDWVDLGVARVRVLTLERLIQIKLRLGRPKDQAMLPLLLAALDETNRSEGCIEIASHSTVPKKPTGGSEGVSILRSKGGPAAHGETGKLVGERGECHRDR